MRCSKCGYVSFDHHASCPKCKKDLSEERTLLGVSDYRATPPYLIGHLLGEPDTTADTAPPSPPSGIEQAQEEPSPLLPPSREAEMETSKEGSAGDLDFDLDALSLDSLAAHLEGQAPQENGVQAPLISEEGLEDLLMSLEHLHLQEKGFEAPQEETAPPPEEISWDDLLEEGTQGGIPGLGELPAMETSVKAPDQQEREKQPLTVDMALDLDLHLESAVPEGESAPSPPPLDQLPRPKSGDEELLDLDALGIRLELDTPEKR